MTPLVDSKPIAVNIHKGRDGAIPIDTIVIHVTEGNAASVIAWFNNPEAKASAHYMVQRDGKIVRFVSEEDTAWHAGRVNAPVAPIVLERRGINPNNYSIGIEHEGSGREELTDAQRASSIALIRDICLRHTIPIDRRHIIGHREIFSFKTCPGKISVDRLVSEARAVPSGASPSYPRVVYSPYLRDWLVVTRYASDTDWSYVPFSQLPSGTRGGAPLSALPLKEAP